MKNISVRLGDVLGITVGLAVMSAFAEIPLVQTADFASGTPAGWTVENGAYRSPEYSSAVDRIELRYSGTDASASATIYAIPHEGAESQIATFNAFSSGASLDFPDATAFRSFRIAPVNGLALSSFTAYISAVTLAVPADIAISNNVTGTSFDAYWNSVDGATGYKVYVWTNTVAGASDGTAVWQETMPGATNASSSTKLTDAKFANCFENVGWTRSDKAGYPTGEDGTIRIGTSGDNGWIQTPQINHAADGMAVRFFAKANATNTKSMDITVERVSGETAIFAGTATLTTDMQDFTVVLSDWESGDCIRFNSITNGDRRVVIGTVTVVSGYSEGHEEPAYIVDGLDVGAATSHSFTDLPSVPVYFAVEANGRRGVVSPKTDAMQIDLAHPDQVAVLNACPLSSLTSLAHIYSQNFDSLALITASTGDKEWLNGTTIQYWQLYKNTDAVTSINYNGGAGTVGGQYALASDRSDPGRALGAYSTKDNEYSFGIAFTNDTGSTKILSSLVFSAQQWGFANTTNQTLSVSVMVTDRLNWISSYAEGWTALGSTQSALYGEGTVHDTPVSTPVSINNPVDEIAIAPGQVLMLKWTIHSLKSGKPGMIGIDDVSVEFQNKAKALSIHMR